MRRTKNVRNIQGGWERAGDIRRGLGKCWEGWGDKCKVKEKRGVLVND